jgi:hypothetical protein
MFPFAECRLSQWFIVDVHYDLKSLYHMDVGSVVDILEVYVVFIFRVNAEDRGSMYLRNFMAT